MTAVARLFIVIHLFVVIHTKLAVTITQEVLGLESPILHGNPCRPSLQPTGYDVTSCIGWDVIAKTTFVNVISNNLESNSSGTAYPGVTQFYDFFDDRLPHKRAA